LPDASDLAMARSPDHPIPGDTIAPGRTPVALMTFDVEVVLKGRDVAVTEAVTVLPGDPAGWSDVAVRDVLVEILWAIERVQGPNVASDRVVVLQGFS
jgi:hypothetical protein